MARGGQAKVMAIGPLEQESTPRYRKSSHRVDMAVPFRDLLDFATRVEGEGGILEEVVLESARGPRAGDRAGAEDVRAQFRLTTIEPSEEARRIVERALAASLKKSRSGFAAAAPTLPTDAPAAGALPVRARVQVVQPPPRRA